jgi:hypothetical protein
MTSKSLNTICYMGLFLAIIFVLSGHKKNFVEGFDNPIDYPAPSSTQSISCKLPSKPSGMCKKRIGFWCSLV